MHVLDQLKNIWLVVDHVADLVGRIDIDAYQENVTKRSSSIFQSYLVLSWIN